MFSFAQFFEILLIGALVAGQLLVYLGNLRRIRGLRQSYPEAGTVRVVSEVMPVAGGAAPVTYDALLAPPTASTTFARIVADTNEYLLNNKGAAADFNILKDISERHAEAGDEQIQARLSTPLYLGLLGTFLGAILGLLSIIPQTGTVEDAAIRKFLLGIMIAMVGSFFGLAFTLLGNNQLQTARARRDELKNAYYTLLQKALLPKLNSDMQTGLASLRAVLTAFNEDFFGKIQQDFFAKIAEFTPLVANLTSNISIQKDFLARLQEIGITQMATSAVQVFNRVDESAQKFEKFLGYQQALNDTVREGTAIAGSINALLNRLTALETALTAVPGYLAQHDHALREQMAAFRHQLEFFGQHEALLQNASDLVRQKLDHGIDRLDGELDAQLQLFERRAQEAYGRWQQRFERLNEDNVYQKITEYLNPFQQLPAAQQHLNRLQEEQARRSAQALAALEQRIGRDEQVQRELLAQLDRTNAVLEKLTEPNWFQRTVLGRKGPAPRRP